MREPSHKQIEYKDNADLTSMRAQHRTVSAAGGADKNLTCAELAEALSRAGVAGRGDACKDAR